MTDTKRTAAIITFGCKVNQTESAAMEHALREAGYEVVHGFPKDTADLVVVNTCVVTSRAEAECRRAVKRVHRTLPQADIAVAGCYSEIAGPEIAKLPGVRFVIGNTEKERFPKEARLPTDGSSVRIQTGSVWNNPTFSNEGAHSLLGKTRVFLKIQDGCESFCSYCIVPYTRGRSRSLAPDAVLGRLREIGDRGVQEAVLTGIHLGRYGRDTAPPTSLLDLLQQIEIERPVPRIRLSSIEPLELSEELITAVAESRCVAPHFHVPLQSGDPEILKNMNRNYSPDLYAHVVTAIKEALPSAAVGADVIVGFPGEQDAHFQKTIDLVSSLPLSYLHVFKYSKRSGTPASRMKNQVSQEILEQRSRALIELGLKKRAMFRRSWIGRTARLLVEGSPDRRTGLHKGYTDEYVPVHVSAHRETTNRLVRVRIVRIDKEILYGEVLTSENDAS
ncbi:MAG: tRNA (N(6)-L-threonylcarbamoyladenosine(37)-C(2))-methylthiotransferase MtaB [Deltaproteobacteria bacterium]|nr:tRNA (N(6)-L-threonylcarbamoyladenosine(37)-C(2))-methylthiotransferase MtaB [Deltaproteobacteria bacterium]